MLNAIERAKGIKTAQIMPELLVARMWELSVEWWRQKSGISGLWGVHLAIKRRTEMRYLRLGHKVGGVLCFLCHFLKVKEFRMCITLGEIQERERGASAWSLRKQTATKLRTQVLRGSFNRAETKGKMYEWGGYRSFNSVCVCTQSCLTSNCDHQKIQDIFPRTSLTGSFFISQVDGEEEDLITSLQIKFQVLSE